MPRAHPREQVAGVAEYVPSRCPCKRWRHGAVVVVALALLVAVLAWSPTQHGQARRTVRGNGDEGPVSHFGGSDPVDVRDGSAPPGMGARGLLAVVATSLVAAQPQTDRYHIQRAALQCSAALQSETDGAIVTVVFNREPTTATELGVRQSYDVDTNEHGTPLLRSLVDGAWRQARELGGGPPRFVGYANADIVFAPLELKAALEAVAAAIDRGELSKRAMVIGQRSNFDWASDDDAAAALRGGTGCAAVEGGVTTVAKLKDKATLFSPWAVDYMFATHSAINWTEVPPYVIGRVGWDNYVVHYATQLDPSVSTVDATPAVTAVHLTGSDGNFAGHAAKPDHSFNHALARAANAGFMRGKTENAGWVLSRGVGAADTLNLERRQGGAD